MSAPAPNKPQPAPQTPDPGPHPEKKRHANERVPGEDSSKVAPDTRPDNRTAHDKDGNEQRPAGGRTP